MNVRWRRLGSPVLPWLPVAVVIAAAIEVGLRALRLPRLAALLGVPLVTAADPTLADRSRSSNVGRDRPRIRAALIVIRYWPFGGDGKCLRRSLLIGAMIRNRRPLLHLGARRAATGVTAHAWLTVDGAALDTSTDIYRPLRSVS